MGWKSTTLLDASLMFILCCCTGSLPSGRTTLLLAEGWSGRLQDHLRPHQSCPIGRLQDQLRPHQSCPMSHAQNHACWHLCAYGWGSAHPRDFRRSKEDWSAPCTGVRKVLIKTSRSPTLLEKLPFNKGKVFHSRCDSCLDFVPENGGRMEAWGGR